MRYLEAENELRQAIDLAPSDPGTYEDLGLTQLLDSEYGAAEKSFQSAIDVKPDDPKTFINLANFYKGQNAPERAEQVLRQGMEKNPRAVELPIALAALYWDRERLPDAKRVLQKLEADEGDFADGPGAVGDFYLEKGDAAAALERFQGLIKRNAHDPSATKKIAECYLQLGRWKEANDWIEQSSRDNKDADFRLLQARSHLGALRLREAAAELQDLLKDSPDISVVYYYLAQVYIRQEEAGQAQQAFMEALRYQPGYLPALIGLGNISLQQNDAEGALRYASQVIATSFWVADAHAIAGSAYLLRGDLDQSQRAFELALGLNPRSPQAQERLGAALSRRGNYPDAEKAYEASLALAPDYAPALSGLAEILVKQGRAKQASARIARHVAAQPGSYQLQVAKAEFCIAQKDWPCAERSYQEALTLNPYYVNGYLALAHVYAATDRPSKVIQEYETARSKFPDYLPTYVLLAQVYEYVGDVSRAQQTYERALTVDPNFYLALTNLARLYADHGGPLDEALRLAQKAKAAQPEDPNVNDALGWIYYKDGLYRSAVPVLEAAVAKSPQVGKFQFHLGMVYLASGQSAQARNALQTALNLGLSGDDTRSAQAALQKAGS
jgi:tetratricopeptide (TPR) repeat protein